MPLKKYFKEEQKVLLRTIEGDGTGKVESLTSYLKGQGTSYLDLELPYGASGDESYPFDTEKKFEILSDSMGIGIRLTGHFEKYLSSSVIRIRHNSDLTMIKRRVEERRDMIVSIGYTKGTGKLRSFQQQWEKNLQILKSIADTSKLPKFPNIPVNISPTGVGFKVKTPVQIADLCLIYLDLKDGQPPICTMSEVVWRSDEETKGRCMAGFQFLSILESDQKRILKLVKAPPKKEED